MHPGPVPKPRQETGILDASKEHSNRIDLYAYLVHLSSMKTTLNIDDALLAEAERLTSIAEKTALVRAGLEALIAREHARRLAQLGGTERTLRVAPRRRAASRRRAAR